MTSLLPPNATRLERGLEAGLAPIATVERPIELLWDPATIPLNWLPWLAYSLSVDSWDPDWPEATKRQAVAESIALHRLKGTRASVEMILRRLDTMLEVVEWHEADWDAAPHTFDVLLPLVTAPGTAPGGERASAGFAEKVIREVAKVKPLREHMTLVQTLRLQSAIGVVGTARLSSWQREPLDLTTDTSPEWDGFLQTEDGEPFEAEGAAGFLDHT